MAALVVTPADRHMRAARLARFAPAPAPASTSATQPRQVFTHAPHAPAAEASTSASSVIDSRALFRMDFDKNDVGRALTETLGDVPQALKKLQKQQMNKRARPESDGCHGEEDAEDLALAIKMSLEKPSTAAPASSSDARGSNPDWDPPRYQPTEGNDALRVVGGKTLSLVEFVEVRDGGYAWQPASAFLDTGNQHMTIVDTGFARRHAIYRPDEAAALFGAETTGSGFGQAEGWTTVQGVVPGASSRAPVVTIALKIRGEEFVIKAIVSQMKRGESGHDLLLGCDVLERLFRSGFGIGAGSV